MVHFVGSRKKDYERNRSRGAKIPKSFFRHFPILGHQKYSYMFRMQKYALHSPVWYSNTGLIWSVFVIAVYSERKWRKTGFLLSLMDQIYMTSQSKISIKNIWTGQPLAHCCCMITGMSVPCVCLTCVHYIVRKKISRNTASILSKIQTCIPIT